MCLSVSKLHAVDANDDFRPVPLKADEPMLVWKALREDRCGYKTLRRWWTSPFFGFPYTFKETYSSIFRILSPKQTGDKHWIIEDGLHAYMQDSAVAAHDLFKQYFDATDQHSVFPAVIPAGAKFFIGRRHDVASNLLVVYENMEDVISKYGNVKCIQEVFPIEETETT